MLRRRLCTVPIRYDALVARSKLRADPQQRKLAGDLEALRVQLLEHSSATATYAAAASEWHVQMVAYERKRAAKLAAAADEWIRKPLWRRTLLQLTNQSPPAEVMSLVEQQEATTAPPAATDFEQLAMPTPRLRLHHASADHESDGEQTQQPCGTCGKPQACSSHTAAPQVPVPPPAATSQT